MSKINTLLEEAIDLLNESSESLNEDAILLESDYEVRRGNLLYNGNEFIGSFDNEREKNELIEEYEEEQNKKLNKSGTNNN